MTSHPSILHYNEQGQGTPLILLHGFPFDHTLWDEQARALSDHYRVITPDFRGFGTSPISEGTYHMESAARDILALMDSLNIPKAGVFGHSMGGYVALALWQLAPERISALGLVCTHAWADTQEVRQGREKTADQVFNGGAKVLVESLMPRLFAPDIDTTEPFLEVTRQMILSAKAIGIVGALRGMASRPDLSASLPQITVPTAIIAGDKDQIVPLNRAEAMAGAIPHAVLITIENSGHMPMFEQPQATALAIRHFLGESLPNLRT